MESSDKSGIYSLAGYAYQIKVFILQLLQLKKGYTLGYETIDDVALKIDSDALDIYEDSLYCTSTTTNKANKVAIQVKKTEVKVSDAKKIVKNWILIDKNNTDISHFKVITSNDVDKDVFNKIEVNEICSEIQVAKGKKSNDFKIKSIGYSNDELKDKVNKIVSKASIQKCADIDQQIIDKYETFFIRQAVTDATYILRIQQLMQQITVDILNMIIKGQAYELTYRELCSMQNRIIAEVTDEKWTPSFAKFKKLHKTSLYDLATIKAREYQQLKYCTMMTDDDIYRHLLFSDYYVNCRNTYFECGMSGIVDDLEETAYDNFCDVKMELRGKPEDTPDNRLNKTKIKNNSRALDDQIKYGVCIDLTSKNTEKRIQISWKDE